LHNPLSTHLSPLLNWGSVLGQRTLLPPPLPPGDGQITFPIGAECVGGCSISLQLAAVADADRTTLPGNVPTSPMLDPRGPMLASFTLSAEVPPLGMGLAVSLEPARAAEIPRGEAGLTIRLRDALTGKPVGGVVTLAAVDAAILQLCPHPPTDIGILLAPHPGGWYELLTSTYDQLVSAPALPATAAKLRDLLETDPFLRLTWDARPSISGAWQLTDAERPANQTLARNQADLSPLPGGFLARGMPDGGDGVMMMTMDMSPGMAMDRSMDRSTDMSMDGAVAEMAMAQPVQALMEASSGAAPKMRSAGGGGPAPPRRISSILSILSGLSFSTHDCASAIVLNCDVRVFVVSRSVV
jgi:hypothetical protein